VQKLTCKTEQEGYDSAYHGEKSYNGVAILSKTKLHGVRPSLCDQIVDPQARVIAAKVDNLRVCSVYAPNG
jgi:exodeoxyribonuclease-3